MKVIIPVAGVGSKLRPHTHTQPKTLVPIAGKAILGHIIDNLIENGLNDFLFITGYLGSKVEDYVHTYYKDKIQAEFILQEPRQGLAHALWVARDIIIEQKSIFVVLGDTIAHVHYEEIFKNKHSVVGVKKVGNPSAFGIAQTDEKGKVIHLIEKPKIPKSNLALVGIYKLQNIPLLLEGIEYLLKNDLKNNGEYHLTDAMMYMLEKGENIQTIQVENWFDCGKKETLLEANAILLNRPEFKEHLPEFPSTILIPPVSFGKNCTIKNSIIGPNVAVGDNTILQSSIVQNSIIGSFSELESVVLKDSIIGNDSALTGLNQSLNIGDNTEINFSK